MCGPQQRHQPQRWQERQVQDWGRERLQPVPDAHASPAPGPGPALAAAAARPVMKMMMTWQGSGSPLQKMMQTQQLGWLVWPAVILGGCGMGNMGP